MESKTLADRLLICPLLEVNAWLKHLKHVSRSLNFCALLFLNGLKDSNIISWGFVVCIALSNLSFMNLEVGDAVSSPTYLIEGMIC